MVQELWSLPFTSWRQSVLSTEPVDRKRAEEATNAAYTLLGREHPWYVWCDGPFELAVLPSLFIAVVRADLWRDVVSHYASNVYPGERWEPYRKRLEHELVDWHLEEFLKGVEIAPQLEPSISQVKDKLSEALYWRARYESRTGDTALSQKLLRGTGDRLTAPSTTRYGTMDLKIDTLTKLLASSMRNFGRHHPTVSEQAREMSDELRGFCASFETLMSTRFQLFGGNIDQQWQSVLMPGFSYSLLAQYLMLTDTELETDQTVIEDLQCWYKFCRSVFACRQFQYLCFLCNRPSEVNLDERQRVDNTSGPAIKFRDGLTVYARHGITVASHVIEQPETISLREIHDARNIEHRRVLIEQYGTSRFLLDSGATIICQDECGTLYFKDMGVREEPILMVKVTNSTPEPDGSYRQYFLRVPPQMRTARQAVAWTFGMESGEYGPERET